MLRRENSSFDMSLKDEPEAESCEPEQSLVSRHELKRTVELGLPLIPAYSEASGDQVLHGVNYASAAASILDITGRNFVGRIPFSQQIRNFQNTLDQITGNLGAIDLSKAIVRSIFFVGMGSNDYLNNYLMPNYNTKNEYNAQQYADLLIEQYARQLTSLYNLGARKFVLAGLGRMGYMPSILAQNQLGTCSEEVNQLVLPFNTNVKTMINNLNANLPGSKFIYIDIARMFEDLLVNYISYGMHTLLLYLIFYHSIKLLIQIYVFLTSLNCFIHTGFSVIDRGCYGIGQNRGQITCLPFQTPCPNRDQYVFWDAFHPTKAVNILFGKKAFSGDLSNVYPMNIQQLVNLDIGPA
ncbi:GDSL esterase/lipase At1g71691-like [Mangifera indica]|uniref:GDSL esterase/lipase At1g71691-like n=1 Tax=Mangifera indica TaxID=29780 RepID=UPI001CF97CA9|nr:GDSL esterase/lipase At1g71691-like [Mangifera indica]